MRCAILLALLLLPWAGCLTPGGDGQLPIATTIGRLFEYAAVERGDPTPERVTDCAALLDVLNQRALDQARVSLEQSVENGGYGWGWGYYRGDTMTMAATASAAAMDSAAAGAQSYSSSEAQVTGTNNQEAAADEADIVKTDGEWTYIVQGQVLRILRSPNIGDLEAYAEVKLEGSWGGELLLERRDPANPADDRLVLITQKSAPMPASDQARVASGVGIGYYPPQSWSAQTHVMVLSLADRAKPQVIHDLAVDGYPVGARLVDGRAHVVVLANDAGLPLQSYVGMDEASLQRFGLDWESYYQDTNETVRKTLLAKLAREADERNVRQLANLTLADHVPQVTRDGMPTIDKGCQPLLQVDGGKGRGVTTILSLDVQGGKVVDRAVQMLGASSILYASGDALVLTAPTQEPWWYWVQPELQEATDLHWFTLDGLEVRHLASGRVPGQVLDSFSLDVHDGRLRVATTTGQWARNWLDDPEPMMSHLAVFDAVGGQLVLAGMVGGLAPGEKIWSARFTDTRAYIVTFRQTDPLWVIDLSGTVPTVLGELKIPGVSTYLHPLADDKLLAVGIGPRGDEGLDWGRIQVSLFDVSDPTDPKRADVMDIAPEGGYAWSTAAHEHKAFTYWAAIGKLALPVQVDGRATLHLVDVDLGHMALYPGGVLSQAAVEQENGWNSIERSWFLGIPEKNVVSVYTLGQAGATAHDLATLELQSAVTFPREERGYVVID
ncbi:MAG: hypothetical protein QOD77_137 [Thermoplasmata archaeon]|jgi:uncharacterized secreted protein with C-terminal beta-propeller domain|nr:hypothetical protein [Thermoplasmata archaeon]